MPNPLDMVTEDQRDEPVFGPTGRRRVYIYTDPETREGEAFAPSNKLTQAVAPEAPQFDLMKGLEQLKQLVAQHGAGILDQLGVAGLEPGPKRDAVKSGRDALLGTGPGERFQTWPEKMVRSAVDAPHAALTSETPVTSEQMIAPAQDIAGLASGSTLFAKPGAATLGSGPVRPGASVVAAEAPVFYSALEHAATNAAQDVMSPQQWSGYLKNQPGVKAEELAWTGLPEWLGAQKGKVKKEDVQAYLDEHKVEIKDVTKKGEEGTGDYHHRDMDAAERYASETMQSDFDRLPAKERAKYESVDDWIMADGHEHLQDRHSDFANRWLDENAEPIAGPADTKYSSYQLPGGENYREHLLTMPLNTKGKEAALQAYHAANRDRVARNVREPDTAERAAWKEVERFSDPEYRSSHWDEPNVLAHVRTNDRYMPDGDTHRVVIKPDPDAPGKFQVIDGGEVLQGRLDQKSAETIKQNMDSVADQLGMPTKGKKSLHIEEIQSDWHQQGRKQGYRQPNPEITAELKDISKRIEGKATDPAYWAGAEGWVKEAVDAGRITQAEADKLKAYNDAWTQKGVPDVPFKTSWPELALKRMIRKAAEEGYDRVSWTPGEAQAARYDLSKTVDAIRANLNPDGTFQIGVQPKGRNMVPHDTSVPAEKLASVVGKELADKITKEITEPGVDKGKKFEGLDLKVGGKGMRDFYDKTLPKMVEKIGKSHGVKVKQTNLGGEALTPNEVVEMDTLRTKYRENIARPSVRPKPTKGEMARLKELDDRHKNPPQPVHYFDIPPSLREHAVGKGFPLYMSGIPFPLTPVDHDPFKEQK